MNISISPVGPMETTVDLLALPLAEDALSESPVLDAIDAALDGSLRRAMKEEAFRGKTGQTLTLHTLGRLRPRRVSLFGIGPRSTLRAGSLASFGARAIRAANGCGAATLALALPADLAPNANAARAVQSLVEGAVLGEYHFDRYLAEDRRTPRSLVAVHLLLDPDRTAHETDAALLRGQRVGSAIARARDLVNEPAGTMTPKRLAEIATEIAARPGLQIKIFGPKECEDQGMGLFLAVARGSTEEPRFVHLTWSPKGATKRIVLIGKGVTFDSGGLSLKPNDAMLDMKTDMAGAAAVLSVMEAVAQENLPIEVHALAACTENMISGSAYKLGDVLRSKAGKTVEINNTDAEGRLTLADAITYARDLKPDVILDFATLTGACIVALGPHIAGVMSNDDTACAAWLDAATTAGEEMWRLPLPDRLLEQLKSDVADMKNTGERWGGALTAGLFLKEFVGDVPWVHVDLAGPSTSDKEAGTAAKGGTGFAVATIFEYLRGVSRI